MTEPAIDNLRLVAVKFRPAGRHYDFNAQGFDLQTGTRVVVETDRGRALGTVVRPPREAPRAEAPEDLKNVLRLATEEDLYLASGNAAREEDAYRFCLQRIQDRKMEMKLVRAEYLFDGSKVIFYFTADGRVDFRELVKDLAHHFHTRIEMRQIGVRDEAKLIGGLGICGRELCCCTFLSEFAPVSVKMAKEQGLALNPGKISGQCGRLLCCLAYEFETYCELKKNLPKCGRRVPLDGREVEVVEQDVLGQKVKVRFEDGATREITAENLARGRQENTPEAAREETPARPERKPAPEKKRGTPAEAPRNATANADEAGERGPQGGEAGTEGRTEGKRRRSRRRSRRK